MKLFANNFKIIALLIFSFKCATLVSQTQGPKPPKNTNYKNDSTYNHFYVQRFKVAKAQIQKLKTDGALLVRLKTNSNAIKHLKANGNADLATQIQLQTELENKIIMESYKSEFNFCPVYFFYSHYSDSVKHQKLTGILLDSSLIENTNIICANSFYLIADESSLANSTLGLVPLSQAPFATETGAPSRDNVPIVIKNRYYIQLHKPFPYFQIKGLPINDNELNTTLSGALIYLLNKHNKISNNNKETKRLKKLKGIVKLVNKHFNEFYNESLDYKPTPEILEYVY